MNANDLAPYYELASRLIKEEGRTEEEATEILVKAGLNKLTASRLVNFMKHGPSSLGNKKKGERTYEGLGSLILGIIISVIGLIVTLVGLVAGAPSIGIFIAGCSLIIKGAASLHQENESMY